MPYVDPGTGSFILQALVAMLAGAAVALKVYWGKLRGLFGASPRDDEEATPEDGAGDA